MRGKGGEEERGFFGGFRGRDGFVALGDGVKVEQRLPAGFGD